MKNPSEPWKPPDRVPLGAKQMHRLDQPAIRAPRAASGPGRRPERELDGHR
jgi:hypothetical protein